MAELGPRIVLDSSAAIALLRDEPGADTVEDLLRSAHARMSTVNAAEVIDVLVRRHVGLPDEVLTSVDQLFASAIEAVPPSLEVATRAGELRARLFDRRRSRISLADCFVLATAGPGDGVATGDELLATVARDEGFAVVPLRT
ncbi:MAG: PIN domain-containing protein [Gaiellaceae bacterium]